MRAGFGPSVYRDNRCVCAHVSVDADARMSACAYVGVQAYIDI